MSIHINTININVTDHHHFHVDSLDPEDFAVEEESPDPVMPDEEPDTSGLDPQQEVEAAIAKAFAKDPDLFYALPSVTGDIATPSWIDAIVETVRRTAEDRAVVCMSGGLPPGMSLF